MNRILCCYLVCLLTLTSALAQTAPGYTTHKVTSGQTLYSISRQYGVSVAELTKLNPSAKSGLRAGQVLKVPGKPAASVVVPEKPVAAPAAKTEPASVSKPASPENAGAKTHKVAPKQTLLGIANRYKVTMAEIRKWNNLKSDKLKPGQVLIVSGGTAEAPVSESAKPVNEPIKIEDTKVTYVRSETKVKGDKIKTETKTESIKAAAEIDTATDKEDIGLENKSVEYAGKVTETGLAEVISQAGDNNKFLALHKTAPVGTILQVKNIMNGQNVYVRVIGKLPDTGINDKVIVRISKQAYQRLAALDNRFRVEVSYMP
jgi:LysM repeat protein